VAERLGACCAVLLAASCLSACGASHSTEVVARVGESAITKEAYAHWLSTQTAADHQARPDRALRQRVLDFLISASWTVGEAGELGVRVSDSEAGKQLGLYKYDQLEGLQYEGLPKHGKYQRLLQIRGLKHADGLWLMKLALTTTRVEQEQLRRAQEAISPAQIASYYSSHRRRFVLPQRRDIEIIMTRTRASIEKAKREVQSGKDFLSVARRVSRDPEAPHGLQLGLSREDEEPEFTARIFAAKPRTLVGPIRQALNYHIFEVINITPRHVQRLARAQAAIRRRLAAYEVAAALPEAFQRKWSARTTCEAGYVARGCRQYTGA
jgi:foldase protein PrsA